MTEPTRLNSPSGIDMSALTQTNDAPLPVLYVPPALPDPTRQALITPEEPVPANNKIQITLVHPTDSGEEVPVAVSASATPKFLVDQLIKSGFMKPIAATEGRYDITDGNDNQIGAGTTLAAAGIADGARLKVIPHLNGATCAAAS